MIEQSKGKKSPLVRLVLLAGVWYAAIGYYLLVYLPTRNGIETPGANPEIYPGFPAPPPPMPTPSRPSARNRLLGVLGWFVYLGWEVFCLFVICIFLSTSITRLIQPVAVYIILYPLAMVLLTLLFVLLRFISGEP
jgi:hypothetical protein